MSNEVLYQVLKYSWIGAAAACGVFLVISVVLFFTLDIPQVISYLTGRTARKAIENIRQQNGKSGDNSKRPGAANMGRENVTDKISKSGRLIPDDHPAHSNGMITEKIGTQKLGATEEAGATTLLSEQDGEYGATTLLSQEGGNYEAQAEYGETSVLAAAPAPVPVSAPVITIEFEISYIHTDEVVV